MDFLYPIVFPATHKLRSKPKKVFIDYPNGDTYKAYDLPYGISVSAVEINVGPKQKWHKVKIIDLASSTKEYYNKVVYIEKIYLKAIDARLEYATTNQDSLATPSSAEVAIQERPIFEPFIDKKNGFLSVRVSTDYDKIIDSSLFQAVLQEVADAGAQILLEYKGIKADNATLASLKQQYQNFIYVSNDLDITIRSICESLTFTVSVPLAFIDQIIAGNGQKYDPPAWSGGPTLEFTNKNLFSKIDKVLEIFLAREKDINDLLYPNKIIANFNVLFEIASLKSFLTAAKQLLTSFSSPETITYILKFSDKLDLEAVDIETSGGILTSLTRSQVARLQLTGEFSSKRIFSYLINLDSFYSDMQRLDIDKLLEKYVQYPSISIQEDTITAGGTEIKGERAKQFIFAAEQTSEACITFGDVADLTNIITDPVYHIWREEEKKLSSKGEDDFLSSLKKDLQGASDSIESSRTKIASLKSSIRKERSRLFQKLSSSENGEQVLKDAAVKIADIEKQISDEQKTIPGKQYTRDQLDAALSDLEDSVEKAEKKSMGLGVKLTMGPSISSRIDSELSDINTYMYILRRANFGYLFMKKIVCIIKDLTGEELSPDVQQFIQGLPEDIFYYFRYWETLQNRSGAELARAIASGLPINMKLFCTTNAAAVYWVRGILKVVRTIPSFKGIGEAFTKFKKYRNEEYEARTFSEIMAEALYQSLRSLVLTIAVDAVISLLYTNCDDRPADITNYNFDNPLNTHKAIPTGAGGGSLNNDNNVLAQNRADALATLLPASEEEIVRTYGVTKEYFVDILNRFIQDISCILSPSDTLDLLKGNAEEAVITTIRNLIRSRYSSGENDLRYLLDDPRRIRLLFQRLGLSVDQQLLEKIAVAISDATINGMPPDDPAECKRCPDDPGQIVEYIDRLPPDIDLLRNRNARRAKRAKELIDKIKNGADPITIGPEDACRYNEDDVIEATKQLQGQYKTFIDATFEDVRVSFNDEAHNIYETYVDTNTAKRGSISIDKPLQFAGSVEWDGYNSQLGYSLKYSGCAPSSEQVTNSIDPKVDSTTIENYSFSTNVKTKFKYFNYPYLPNIELDYDQLAKIYLQAEGSQDIKIICVGDETKGVDRYFSKPDESENNTGVFVSFTLAYDAPWHITGDIDDLWDSSKGVASVLRSSNRNLFIGIEADYDLTFDSDTRWEITFTLFYRDDFRQKFVVLSQVGLKDFGNAGISAQGFYNNLEANATTKQYSTGDDLINLFGDGWTGDTAYTLKQFLSSHDAVRTTLRGVYDKYFAKFEKNVEDYRVQVENMLKIRNLGVFHMENRFNEPIALDGGSVTTMSKRINFSNMKRIDKRNHIVYENYLTFDKLYLSNNTLENGGLSSFRYQEQPIIEDEFRKEFTKYIIPNIYKHILKDNKYIKFTYNMRTDFTFSKLMEGNLLNQFSNAFLLGVGATPAQVAPFNPENKEFGKGYWNEFHNKEIYVTRKEDLQEKQKNPYSKMTLLSKNPTFQEAVCNVSKDYLDIPSFRDPSLKVVDLCVDDFPEYDYNEVLVNLIYRVFVADLMVRAAPFLTKLIKREFTSFYKEKYAQQILFEFFKKEMLTFSSPSSETNIPFNVLERLTKELYNKYQSRGSAVLNPEFIDESSKNKEIEYFIKREIAYFIAYTLKKEMLEFANKSFVDDLYDTWKNLGVIEDDGGGTIDISAVDYLYLLLLDDANKENWTFKNTDGLRVASPLDEWRIKELRQVGFEGIDTPAIKESYYTRQSLLKNLIEIEFNYSLAFILTASTADAKQKSIFAQSKMALIKLLLSEKNIDTGDIAEQDQIDYLAEDASAINKFLNTLPYAHSPYALMIIYPHYTKYIKFFLKQMLTSFRAQVMNEAKRTDPNIMLTRMINDAVSLTTGIGWAFTPQKTREEILYGSNFGKSLLFARVDQGRAVTPDAVMAGIVAFSGLPVSTWSGGTYLALDTLYELKWASEWYAHWLESRPSDVDPCEDLDEFSRQLCDPEKKAEQEYVCDPNYPETCYPIIPSCPPGSVLINGSCVQIIKTREPPPLIREKCLDGYIRAPDGSCVPKEDRTPVDSIRGRDMPNLLDREEPFALIKTITKEKITKRDFDGLVKIPKE